ncbi:MAG: hypothetical protein ACYC5Q_07310 [Thermoleophilia bacterium]
MPRGRAYYAMFYAAEGCLIDAQDARHLGDYDFGPEIPADEAQKHVSRAEEFVASVRTFLDRPRPEKRRSRSSGVRTSVQTIRLATLSFFEYVNLRRLSLPTLPEVNSLARLVPFEVKYRATDIRAGTLKGLT